MPRDEPPALEELNAFLGERGMAKQYWPERLKVLSEMPRTPSGKIQKFVLREQVADDVGARLFDHTR